MLTATRTSDVRLRPGQPIDDLPRHADVELADQADFLGQRDVLAGTAQAGVGGEAGERLVMVDGAGCRVHDGLEHDLVVAAGHEVAQLADGGHRIVTQLRERPRQAMQSCRILVRAAEAIDQVEHRLGDLVRRQFDVAHIEAGRFDAEPVRLRIGIAGEVEQLLLELLQIDFRPVQDGEAVRADAGGEIAA